MKRYLLFAGYQYYPRGGWTDFIDSFDTKEEAFAETARYDWCHVVDTQEWSVDHSYEQPD
jgi:hypothetical protein